MLSECQEEAGGHGESARLVASLAPTCNLCMCTVACLSYNCSTFKGSFRTSHKETYFHVYFIVLEIVLVLCAHVLRRQSLTHTHAHRDTHMRAHMYPTAVTYSWGAKSGNYHSLWSFIFLYALIFNTRSPLKCAWQYFQHTVSSNWQAETSAQTWRSRLSQNNQLSVINCVLSQIFDDLCVCSRLGHVHKQAIRRLYARHIVQNCRENC